MPLPGMTSGGRHLPAAQVAQGLTNVGSGGCQQAHACVPRVEHPTKSPMRGKTKFPELPRRPWRPASRPNTGAERYRSV